ncbi:hypothetical protein evm_005217 [Chilo suppressalis]|nr:hypothetical protein evm_005217 [Chilo suppressalis]
MKVLQVSAIVIVICLALTNARYRRHRPNSMRPLGSTKVPIFPSEMPYSAYQMFKVPSKEFCEQMDIQPAHHYVVLPWWYHYCGKLYEEIKMKENKRLPNFRQIKRVLEAVQQYKRRYGQDEDNSPRRRYGAHIQRL